MMQHMGRLTGKRALMTGAGGALGSALARAFATEGADVVLTTRTLSKLEALAQDVRALGQRAAVIGADFTRNADIDRLAEAAWAAFGGIDIVLISCQPPQPNFGDLLNTTDEAWHEQQQSILWGPFRLLRHLAPKMASSGGGSIITVISSTGLDPITGYGAYGLAKGALWTMTRYMAAEWGRLGIRANSICPGLIATGGSGAASSRALSPEVVRNMTALGRLGKSSEVLGAAIYLASDEASFTSGQCIHVNGGLL
jgi:NAD(P)-dependent dehydrogenase (short-subunit alcohol dehydrogenase family)